MSNRKNIERRLARHGASLHARSTGTWTTFEDGTVAPWMLQWGTVQIPFSTLANVDAFLDRIQDVR